MLTRPAAPSPSEACEAVLRRLDPQWGQPNSWRVDGPPIQGKASAIFRARNAGAPFDLAVKIYNGSVRPELAEAQAALLRRCRSELARAPGLDVPVVLDALAEQRALVMEWIEGPSLSLLLRQAGGDRVRRAAIFAVAGRWLSVFHRQGGIVVQPLATDFLRNRIDKVLRSGRETGLSPPGAAFRYCHEAFLRLEPRFAGLPVAYASCHGDFNPNNLHHGNGRTVGIDLEIARRKPALTDACHFLLHGETSKRFLTRRSNISDLGVERSDLAAFLSAYGEGANAPDERLLAFVFLSEVLHRWATLFARPKGRFHPGRRVKHFRLNRLASAAAAAAASG